MKNFIYFILAAIIYFSLKGMFELEGIGWAIACGAVAGGVVGALAWCVEKLLKKKKIKEKQ